jgi:Ca-activated chloride channel family protein
VTDGEDLEKSGVAVAKNLATNGVVVFTIGVGTPAGKEIQTTGPAGQPELLRDSRGEIVRSRLDEDTLREIAQATDGSYFPLGPQGDGLLKVRSAIHALDVANGLRQALRSGVDHYYWPLAFALAVLIAEPFISTRRKHLPGRS